MTSPVDCPVITTAAIGTCIGSAMADSTWLPMLIHSGCLARTATREQCRETPSVSSFACTLIVNCPFLVCRGSPTPVPCNITCCGNTCSNTQKRGQSWGQSTERPKGGRQGVAEITKLFRCHLGIGPILDGHHGVFRKSCPHLLPPRRAHKNRYFSYSYPMGVQGVAETMKTHAALHNLQATPTFSEKLPPPAPT